MESTSRLDGAEPGTWVDAEAFARFAEDDLRCWRPAIGCAVVPATAQWGVGVIDAVLWASPCEGVEAFIQVRSHYDAESNVTSRPETWALHHRRIRVPDALLEAITACDDATLSADARMRCRERYAARFQELHDERMLARAAELRSAARGDQTPDDSSC